MPDVVIAGYGPAGAAAAIAAHDAGRRVLVLESAGRGGGNARGFEADPMLADAYLPLGPTWPAAAFDRADLATVDLAIWRRGQAVNVESALLLAQAFGLVMR